MTRILKAPRLIPNPLGGVGLEALRFPNQIFQQDASKWLAEQRECLISDRSQIIWEGHNCHAGFISASRRDYVPSSQRASKLLAGATAGFAPRRTPVHILYLGHAENARHAMSLHHPPECYRSVDTPSELTRESRPFPRRFVGIIVTRQTADFAEKSNYTSVRFARVLSKPNSFRRRAFFSSNLDPDFSLILSDYLILAL